MILSVSPLLLGALVWLALVVLILGALAVGSRTAWWEETSEEIDGFPETGPEEPRDRPTQDGRT